MIAKTDLEVCRLGMKEYIGRRVRLKANGKRNRIVFHEGVLDSCYSNIFTVLCTDNDKHTKTLSYSYVDLLTKVVEVVIDSEKE